MKKFNRKPSGEVMILLVFGGLLLSLIVFQLAS